MQLRTNIFANYASQLYITLLAIALVPLLVRDMGAEAYGLVAFFSMLFSVFYVLDLGLTPLVQREVSRLKANALSAEDFDQIWRALFVVFTAVALFGATTLAALADSLARKWLNLNELSYVEARMALTLMGMAVALRWWSGFYRGALGGSERMVWLAGFNAGMATLRFPGALLCMHWLGHSVSVFFWYQLGVAVFECVRLGVKATAVLPRVKRTHGWKLATLKPLWRVGLAGAMAAVCGALLMQADKLLLSGLLPLGDFGHFSMAVLLATSVMVLSSPISTVLMPRLARLHAEGQEAGLLEVYRMGSRLTSALGLGGALTLAFCAKPLLTAWTGQAAWAIEYWPVLSLYALGYGMWAMGSFVYYLQYARGELHWHAWGNALALLVWGLTVLFACQAGGVLAVAVGWTVLSGAYLLGWAGLVHRRYLPGFHWRWLGRDVFAMNWPMVLGILLFSLLGWEPQSRRESFAYLALVGGVLMAMNMSWWAWTERTHWGRWLKGVK
jgi:O-antigen/teichoic acid export membrane protein